MPAIIKCLSALARHLKSFAFSFYNWIFSVQTITVSNRDLRGFNLYEYEASPNTKHDDYLVTFRHTLNGIEQSYWVEVMPKEQWESIRSRLIKSGRYAF